jgi:hypothetical protein
MTTLHDANELPNRALAELGISGVLVCRAETRFF